MRAARWSNVYTTSSPERHSDGLAAPQNVIVFLLKITLFLPLLMDLNHHRHQILMGIMIMMMVMMMIHNSHPSTMGGKRVIFKRETMTFCGAGAV